jgi:hypothetical protein
MALRMRKKLDGVMAQFSNRLPPSPISTRNIYPPDARLLVKENISDPIKNKRVIA